MKKNPIFTSIVAAFLALPLSLAFAQDDAEKGKGKGRPDAGKGRPQGGGFQAPKFADIDTDQSGGVNKEEWIAHQVKTATARAERSFSHVAGDDESISEEELKKMVQRFRQGGQGRRPGEGKGKGTQGKGKGKGDPAAGGGTKPKRPPIEE